MARMLSSLYPTRLDGFKFHFFTLKSDIRIHALQKTYEISANVKCTVTHTVPLKLSAVYLLQDHLLVQRGNLRAIC